MLTPKLKLYATTALISISILPKIAYYSASGYISAYNTTAAYIGTVTEKTLALGGLQAISRNSNEIAALISEAATTYNLNPALLSALISQESAGNADSFSLKEAIGLTQIMPANAKRCGLKRVSELWDEKKNINCGAQILADELKTYKGNLRSALEAYNGGSRLVGKSSQTAIYAQTIINKFAQDLINK